MTDIFLAVTMDDVHSSKQLLCPLSYIYDTLESETKEKVCTTTGASALFR